MLPTYQNFIFQCLEIKIMELENLPIGQYFTLLDNDIIYKVLSFEMEGVKCRSLTLVFLYFPYKTIVELID